jgi:hypothetical protein
LPQGTVKILRFILCNQNQNTPEIGSSQKEAAMLSTTSNKKEK